MGMDSSRAHVTKTIFEVEDELRDRLAKKRALHLAFLDTVFDIGKIQEALGDVEEDDVRDIIRSRGIQLCDDIVQFSPKTSDHLSPSAYHAEKIHTQRYHQRALDFLKMLLTISAVLTPKEFLEVAEYRDRFYRKVTNFVLSQEKEISDYFLHFLGEIGKLDPEYRAAQRAVRENEGAIDVTHQEPIKKVEQAFSTEELHHRLILLLAETPLRAPQLRKILIQLHSKGEEGKNLACTEIQKRIPTRHWEDISQLLLIFTALDDILTPQEHECIEEWKQKEFERNEAQQRVAEAEQKRKALTAFNNSEEGRRINSLRWDFSDAFDGDDSVLSKKSLIDLVHDLRSAGDGPHIQETLQRKLNESREKFPDISASSHRLLQSFLVSMRLQLESIATLRDVLNSDERATVDALEVLIREQIPLFEARLQEVPKAIDELEEDFENALDSSDPDAKDALRSAILALHRVNQEEKVCIALQQRIDWVSPEFQQLVDEYPNEVQEWIADKKRLLPLLLLSDDILTDREDELLLEYHNALRTKISWWEGNQKASEAIASPEMPSERQRLIQRLTLGEFGYARPLLEKEFGKCWFDDQELKQAAQEGIERQWKIAQERNLKLLPTLEFFIREFELETPKVEKKKAKKSSRI